MEAQQLQLLQLAASIRTEALRLLKLAFAKDIQPREAFPTSHEVTWSTKLRHTLFVCEKAERLTGEGRTQEASAELHFVRGILWFGGMSLQEIESLVGMPVREPVEKVSEAS